MSQTTNSPAVSSVDLDAVADRLRVSKAEAESEAKAEGKNGGECWARNSASYKQLRRLSRYVERNGLEGICTQYGDAFSAGERLAETIEGRGLDRDEIREFWLTDVGDGIVGDEMNCVYDDDWVQGFIDGALEVYDAVEPMI